MLHHYGMSNFFVSVGDRYVHYVCGKDHHDRIDLYDLAPDPLKRMIEMRLRNEWKIYVFGFIKQEIEKCYNLNVPDYLKRIVLSYYNDLD